MTKGFEAPVAVTGASGYLGTWVVKTLLERGATVHATVRDPKDTKACGHLPGLAEGTPGTLRLFTADLLREGSFAEAFAGCGVVMHTASPFVVGKVRDPQHTLVEPALHGTRNVLAEVDRVSSIHRVVLTSSVVAIYGDAADCGDAGGALDESHWNKTSSLHHQPYPYSKTVAEKEAWRIAEGQSRWRLVVINPGFIMGPSLAPQRQDATSVQFLRDTVRGTFRSGTLDVQSAWVDVRDVAQAHVEAALRDDASGRHVLSACTMSLFDAGKLLADALGDRVKPPVRALPKWASYLAAPTAGFTWRYVSRNVGHALTLSNTKSQERLGIAYRPLRDTLVEHAEQVLGSS
jgi:dihydroflavonol-4-reductase